MPTTIKLKNSVTTTNTPSSLAQGEVAINITDKKVWVGDAATTPIQLLGAGGSASFGALSCTTLSASGVATFSAGTVSAPAITTTGDTNTGIFFPAADTIAFTEGGVEAMRIDSSGNLGIQITNPSFPLEVREVICATNTNGESQLRIKNSNADVLFYNSFSGNAVGFYDVTSNRTLFNYDRTNQFWNFNTNAAERMRIDSSGNVGIGTTSPVTKLNISGSSVASGELGTLAISGNTTAKRLSIGVDSSGTMYSWMQSVESGVNYRDLSLQPLGGNVGIGLTSPTAKLHSSGSVSFQATTTYGNFYMRDVSTTGQELHIRASAGKNAFLSFTENAVSDNWVIGTEAGNSALLFKSGSATSNTERMRIDSSGNLLFGCTGLTNDAPNNNGRYNQPNGNEKVRVSADTQVAFQFYSPSGGTSSPVGTINVNASSVSYNTSSDHRLKENIAPMTGALATVSALKPVTYTWKSTGEASQGFIAHELAEVCPDAVTGEKDAVDAEGKPVYQGVDTSFLVATLTAAIQEQQAQIEALKAEVELLKGK